MQRLLPVVAATILAGAAPAPSSASGPHALLESYARAWRQADGEALAALYTPDAELVSAAGDAHGRAEIAALYKAAFAAGMAGTILTTKLAAVRTIAPDTAYARGSWTIAAPNATRIAPYCGRFFAVLKRRDRGYRIDSFSEVQLACEAIL